LGKTPAAALRRSTAGDFYSLPRRNLPAQENIRSAIERHISASVVPGKTRPCGTSWF